MKNEMNIVNIEFKTIQFLCPVCGKKNRVA